LGVPRNVSALAENGFELRESATTIHAVDPIRRRKSRKVVDVFVFVTGSKPQIDQVNCVRAWFRGCHSMGKPDDGKNVKKPYKKPTITKLTPEKAKLKLLGQASESHQEAKALLVEIRDSKAKKKSA